MLFFFRRSGALVYTRFVLPSTTFRALLIRGECLRGDCKLFLAHLRVVCPRDIYGDFNALQGGIA